VSDEIEEISEEIIEDSKQEDSNEKVQPLEVIVMNPVKKVYDMYDSVDDLEYDELGVTEEQVKEFEDGDSSSK